ncbi:MAG: hypothetical protein JWP87_2070 [Labilithrix sp.]|nr:hypothetical protein [Labilithrix sp.]
MHNLSLREYLIGQALVGVAMSGASGPDGARKAIGLADEVLKSLGPQPEPSHADHAAAVATMERFDSFPPSE